MIGNWMRTSEVKPNPDQPVLIYTHSAVAFPATYAEPNKFYVDCLEVYISAENVVCWKYMTEDEIKTIDRPIICEVDNPITNKFKEIVGETLKESRKELNTCQQL